MSDCAHAKKYFWNETSLVRPKGFVQYKELKIESVLHMEMAKDTTLRTVIMAVATSQTSCLDCLSFASIGSHPFYDSSTEEDPDCVCAISIGVPFKFIIPSFDVLSVELRQMKIKGYNKDAWRGRTL